MSAVRTGFVSVFHLLILSVSLYLHKLGIAMNINPIIE